jgi:carbon-monoxide dehydrogenase medium subunit
MRATSAERSLVGAPPDSRTFAEAARIAMEESEPSGDVHADAEYRREVVGTLVRQGLQRAYERVEWPAA